jgi:hypothetical protein
LEWSEITLPKFNTDQEQFALEFNVMKFTFDTKAEHIE